MCALSLACPKDIGTHALGFNADNAFFTEPDGVTRGTSVGPASHNAQVTFARSVWPKTGRSFLPRLGFLPSSLSPTGALRGVGLLLPAIAAPFIQMLGVVPASRRVGAPHSAVHHVGARRAVFEVTA